MKSPRKWCWDDLLDFIDSGAGILISWIIGFILVGLGYLLGAWHFGPCK